MRTCTAIVDTDLCTGCGACADACPHQAASLREGVARIDPSLCRGCGLCVGSCPSGAISLEMPTAALQVPARPLPALGRAELPADRPRLQAERYVEPRPPSLLARAAGVVAPVLLDLAVGLGRAWLDRRYDVGSAGAAALPPLGRRRRARRRGRC